MFSQAFNNSTSLSGQPDSQTGTFSFKQSFGKVTGDAGFGPECDLSMSFQALSSIEYSNTTGLGRGFAFSLGGYSGTPAKNNENITFNNGTSYQVIRSGSGQPWTLSHKVKDVIVETVNDQEINIKHKNGDIEILKTTDDNPESFYLDTYKNAAGRVLKFTYDFNDSGYYALTGIADTADTQLVSVQYNNSSVVITMYPYSSTEKKVYTVNLNSNAVYSIQLPDRSEVLLTYIYKSISGQNLMLISKVEYENGVREEVKYELEMYLPAGADLEYLPVISQYTKVVADDQSIVSTYTYSTNDYWGRNSGAVWQSNKDSLLYLTKPYDYNSTVACGGKSTKTTYDRFHQTRQVEETNGDSNIISYTFYEFNSDQDVDLDEQPTIYELPKSKVMRFEDNSGASASAVSKRRVQAPVKGRRENLPAALKKKRAEVQPTVSVDFKEEYEYDDYGNTLKQIEANGVITTSEYYPADGDGGNCPRHPYNMVFYKKSETQQANDGSDSRKKTFKHQAIPAIDGDTARCVLPSSKTYQTCSTYYNYFGTSDPDNIRCLSKSQTVTIGGKSSTKDFTYTFASEYLTIRESLTGHDNIASSTTTKTSRYGLLSLEDRDRNNIWTIYTYDVMDRLSSLTINPGSVYETTTSYTYFEKYDGKIGTMTRQTDQKGIRRETFYNGISQQLHEKNQDEFGQMQIVIEATYDNQERALTYTKYDYRFNTGGTIAETHTDFVKNIYGPWGELKEVQHNNGVCELQSLNPLTMVQTSQVVQRDSNSNIIAQKAPDVTYFNLFSQKEKIETMTLSGGIYSTTEYKCDGFGRRVSTITPLNETASIDAYDDYDRPTQLTHFDGTSFAVGFVDFTAKNAISSIKLSSSNIPIGGQSYDSLLRCTNRTVNGVSTQFDYNGAQIKPSRILNSRGQTVLFDYLNELSGQTKRHATFSNTVNTGDWSNSSKQTDVSFTYATKSDSPPVGRIINGTCSSGNGDANTYTSLGLIKTSTQTVSGVSKTITNTKMTLKGKPLEYTIDSRTVTLSYDEFGRIVSTTDGDYKVETDFGYFDEVSEERVKKGSTLLQTTNFTYDDMGRESSRSISCGKNIKIDNQFDVESKIVDRTTTVDSATLNEAFTYDSRRRLLTYIATTSSNELLPRNEHGKAFSSQTFTYDGLGNINSVVTGFPNGDSNTASFTYDSTNQFRLNQIANSLTSGDNAYPTTVAFTYDADGNALTINDTIMTYTVSGRVSSKNGASYSYDPYDRLVKTGNTAHFYAGGSIVQEVNGSASTDFVYHGESPVVQVSGGNYNVFGLNRNNSVISVKSSSSTTTTTYSPFGSGDNKVRIGFNGRIKDVGDANCYPLGFGTRFFLPSIGGFTSLDTFSPFNSGDMNPYRYCEGDPINGSDPSGHGLIKDILIGIGTIIFGIVSIVGAVFSGGSTLAITFAVIGGVVGIASTAVSMAASVEAAKGNEGTADILNKVSLGLGILSAFLSLGSSAAGAAKATSTRTSMSKASKMESKFFSMTKENDGVGFKHKTRPSFGIDLKSKGKYEVSNNFKTMKIAPDGKLSLSDDLARKRTTNFGKLRVTTTKRAAYKRKYFFNKQNELRSLPRTLYKTGDIQSLAMGVGMLGKSTAKTIVNWDAYSSPPATSESGVDQSIYSAYGMPLNPSIDDEDSDDEDPEW